MLVITIAQFILQSKFLTVSTPLFTPTVSAYVPAIVILSRRIINPIKIHQRPTRNRTSIIQSERTQISITFYTVNVAMRSVLPSSKSCRHRESNTRTITCNPTCTIMNKLRIQFIKQIVPIRVNTKIMVSSVNQLIPP